MSKKFDVIVVGGGYVGLSFAGMLAHAGLQAALLEKRALSQVKPENEPSRLLAIAKASCEIFSEYKLLKNLHSLGQPIKQIRVVDYNSTCCVDFDPIDVGQDHFGYMIEEHDLGKALHSSLMKHPNLTIIEGVKVSELHVEYSAAKVLFDKEQIEAPLVVAADGKHSFIRALTGIEHDYHQYRQFGVVCDINHELNHRGIAVERFMPTGPFAILPKKGGCASSIVWSMDKQSYTALLELPKEQVVALIQQRFGGYLGRIKLASKLRSFPLELVVAKEYFSERVALLGDALHSIHPLAGQGLNLSLRDAHALTQLLIKQKELGLDLGSAYILREYREQRLADNRLMIEATDKLNWIFSNNILPLKFGRRLGMKLVNNSQFLKNAFMSYASGTIAI